jgi:hypothetical protein
MTMFEVVIPASDVCPRAGTQGHNLLGVRVSWVLDIRRREFRDDGVP